MVHFLNFPFTVFLLVDHRSLQLKNVKPRMGNDSTVHHNEPALRNYMDGLILCMFACISKQREEQHSSLSLGAYMAQVEAARLAETLMS